MNIKKLHDSFCQHQLMFKNMSPITIKAYQITMKIFLKLLPDDTSIEQVDFLKVQQFFYWGRTEKNWMPATFLSHHKHLNVFFRWAKKRKFIADNPLDEIEKPKLPKTLPKALKKEEAFRILEMSANYPYPFRYLKFRNHAIFAILLYTGLRKNELLQLKCSHVDLENMTLFINLGKGNKDRIVPIPFPLKTILEKYIVERKRLNKTCPEFFASLNRDCGFTHSGMKRLVDKIKEATGINFHVHKLRHTFATLMIEGGCDIYSLSKMMGHNDIKTTTIYLSASVEHLRGEMSKHPLNYL